jgi:hypothetical protein
LNFLDWLWNLPALPALLIWGGPVEGAIIWLVYRVRITVRKSAAIGDIMPELTESEKVALAWSIRRAIDNEVILYRKAQERGEA